jgi:diguanylate cyclase
VAILPAEAAASPPLAKGLAARWRALPIKARALYVNVFAASFAFFVLATVLVLVRFVTERDRIVGELKVQSAIVAIGAATPMAVRDPLGAAVVLGGLKGSPAVLSARLRDTTGLSFATYGEALNAKEINGVELISHAVLHNGKPVGTLEITATTSAVIGIVARFALVTFVLGALCAVFAVGILQRFQRGIAAPMERMNDVMRTVKRSHDYGVRTGISTQDELGMFASGLDEMLAQIEAQQLTLRLDLEERTEAERRMDHLAHHDAVTSLPNRNGFNRALTTGLARASRARSKLALLFLDLDNFKIVNDTLGHAAGDALLVAVARRLEQSLRAGDTISRLGGDEFALIMEDLSDSRQVAAIAEKVLSVLTQPFEIENQIVFVGVSIGIAIYPDDADRAQHLLRDADTAMYHAKDAGKGVFRFFSQEMNFAVAERLRRETALRFGINKGEFRVVYQPQVALKGDRVTGFEALMRWQHPELGMLMPADFIPIAEEIGLDVAIDEIALRMACKSARSWMDAGHNNFRIAVNISPRHFGRALLVEDLMRILDEAGVPPAVIEVEITEGAAMVDPKQAEQTIRDLKAKGFSIAMDDFGTGYSSLAYLQKFSIDKLKVDRRFVEEAPNSPDKAAILRAILALAKALDLAVVAEGVETPEQRRLLLMEGCDGGQGYLWSGPVDAGTALTILREGRISPAFRAD